MTRAIEAVISIEALRDALSRYDSYHALGDLFTIRDLGASLRVRGLSADISALAIELQSQKIEWR